MQRHEHQEIGLVHQHHGRQQDQVERDQPAQVTPQAAFRHPATAAEREAFLHDQQVQQHRHIAEDLLARNAVVVVQVKNEQAGQEQQPEQRQWMYCFP